MPPTAEFHDSEYELELHAERVGSDFERFTPEHSVLSVGLGLLIAGQECVLSLQREFGGEAESPNTISVVLSPSQQCSNEAITELVLGRSSLGLRLTEQSANLLGAKSLRVLFTISDAEFNAISEQLEKLCECLPYYTHQRGAA